MEGKILGLVKFGIKEFMDDFRLNGTMYMNTIEYFRTLEGRGDVGDENEGLASCYQSEKVNVKITTQDGKSIILSAEDGSLAGQVTTRSNTADAINIFCMYAIRHCNKKPVIDERNLAFGDTYVCISDVSKFCDRIRSAVRAAGLGISGKPVTYVQRESHNGKMDIFTKFQTYSYQSEYRFAITPGNGKPYKLTIGDISDITITGSTKDLNDQIEIVEVPYEESEKAQPAATSVSADAPPLSP